MLGAFICFTSIHSHNPLGGGGNNHSHHANVLHRGYIAHGHTAAKFPPGAQIPALTSNPGPFPLYAIDENTTHTHNSSWKKTPMEPLQRTLDSL